MGKKLNFIKTHLLIIVVWPLLMLLMLLLADDDNEFILNFLEINAILFGIYVFLSGICITLFELLDGRSSYVRKYMLFYDNYKVSADEIDNADDLINTHNLESTTATLVEVFDSKDALIEYIDNNAISSKNEFDESDNTYIGKLYYWIYGEFVDNQTYKEYIDSETHTDEWVDDKWRVAVHYIDFQEDECEE